MPQDDLSTIDLTDSYDELNDLYRQQNEMLSNNSRRMSAELTLVKLQISNITKVMQAEEDRIYRFFNLQESLNDEFTANQLKKGKKLQTIQAANERANQLLIEKNNKIAEINRTVRDKKERRRQIAAINAEYKERLKGEEDFVKKRLKLSRNADRQQLQQNLASAGSRKERKQIRQQALDNGMTKGEIFGADLVNSLQKGLGWLDGYAKKLESIMNDVAEAQGIVDTRLQGSKNKQRMGSYWRYMNDNITQNVGVSPFVKQADVVDNLKKLVGQGISYNVEQRAFLETIKTKIADTFSATEGTLLKLVRIQQQDTTAARLGMESALTAFLNNMYETTEYMEQTANLIRQNIYEASALMGAKEATAFEYQVQKWMGSLHSVGFDATSNLASALGKFAAGDVSALTDGGIGNLLVMAANKANISTAEVLEKGLNDSQTNRLLEAVVEYLGDIYNETKGSKVVAQQFASVYGLTASDLKAAANLATSTKAISGNNLNYNGMIQQLNNMADTLHTRTSTGQMMDNVFKNLNFSIGSSIGNSPVLYSLYQMSGMLEELTGGIALPFVNVFGSGFDLNTTVAQLMRVGAVSGGILDGIGKLISGVAKGSGGGFSGSKMLSAFGVSEGITSVARGSGQGLLTTTAGSTVSESGYIGQEDGSSVKEKTMSDGSADAENQLATAQEESNETKLSTVDEHIIQILELLQGVVDGTALRVAFSGNNPWNIDPLAAVR